MIETLQRFIERLRALGVDVSPAEAIDAARALEAVGPEDRRRCRIALGATLAKDLDAQILFDEAFASFFAAPPRSEAHEGGAGEPGSIAGGGVGGSGPGLAGGRPPRAAMDDEPPPAARPGKGAPATLGRAPERVREPRPARDEAARRPPAPVPDARRGASAIAAPAGRRERERRRAGHRILPPREIALEIARKKRGGTTGATSEAPSPGEAHSGRRRLSRVIAAARPEADGETAPQGPIREPLRRRPFDRQAGPEEERALAREIPRLLDEIRLRKSRRLRRAPRGRLWLKRAIRENLAAGGVPFTIPRREPRRRSPRVLLVVDVSWSVARAAGLFLMLALELLKRDRKTRVYLFVDRPVEATEPLRRWLAGSGARRAGAGRDAGRGPSPIAASGGPGHRPPAGRSGRRAEAGAGLRPPGSGVSFAAALASLPGLNPDAPSDYGRTFYALGTGPLRSPGRDAILVILGDGRTNLYDPLPWAFEEMAERARRVIWLVPEARRRWGTGDSALPLYLRSCDVAVETGDLEGLAHGIREIVRAI
jgi:uncharacterized protein with von Willebrand factor type A (vWA) domain